MAKDHRYRILLVIRWPIGGIRTFMRYVYRNFDSSRFQFSILAPDYQELRLLLEDLKDLRVEYISVKPAVSPYELFKAVLKAVKSGRHDLIHSHGLTAGICSIFPSLLARLPHILTIHETFTDCHFEGFKGKFRQSTLFLLLLLIDVIHSVSHDAQENLLEYIPSLRWRKNLILIQNGIEVERFLISDRRNMRKELDLLENTFLIGFLGRFMPEKGFVHLVDALDLLYKQYDLPLQPIILTFWGESIMGEAYKGGALIRESKAYVKKKGMERSVYFMPFTSNVALTLRGLDAVAMPSVWEACGLLAMEALVAGVPVIGSDCIGLRETLGNTPATVFPTGDSEALAQAVFREMNNSSKKQAEEFREEAAVRFDVRKQASNLEEVMLDLVES